MTLSAWVLIVFMTTGNAGGSTSIDFNTEVSCKQAQAQVQGEFSIHRLLGGVKTICLRRGTANG